MEGKITILLYHDISAGGAPLRDNFAVAEDEFRRQMEYLKQNCEVVGIEALLGPQKNQDRGLPSVDRGPAKPKVLLTFDDGDISNHDIALPVLEAMGFPAVFFVTPDLVGKEGRMDWPMIYELAKSGMKIGSHGFHHDFLPAYDNYALLNELLMSKQVLEKYLRKRVDVMSVPQGFYNKRVLSVARDVGFLAVCVSDAGYQEVSAPGVFVLKRFPIRSGYRLGAFASIVGGRPHFLIHFLENGRAFLRHALGYQVYDRLRRFRSKILAIFPGRGRG